MGCLGMMLFFLRSIERVLYIGWIRIRVEYSRWQKRRRLNCICRLSLNVEQRKSGIRRWCRAFLQQRCGWSIIWGDIRCIEKAGGGKEGRSAGDFTGISRGGFGAVAQVGVEIETGRTHQFGCRWRIWAMRFSEILYIVLASSSQRWKWDGRCCMRVGFV